LKEEKTNFVLLLAAIGVVPSCMYVHMLSEIRFRFGSNLIHFWGLWDRRYETSFGSESFRTIFFF
jgi:hypothetical protein